MGAPQGYPRPTRGGRLWRREALQNKENPVRATLLFLCLSVSAIAAPPVKLFEVTFEEVPRQVDLRHVNVTFHVPLPKPEAVDQIVRQSLESAALVAPQVDILAMAFDRHEDAIEDDKWSGPFVWDAKAQKVMRLKDRKKAEAE